MVQGLVDFNFGRISDGKRRFRWVKWHENDGNEFVPSYECSLMHQFCHFVKFEGFFHFEKKSRGKIKTAKNAGSEKATLESLHISGGFYPRNMIKMCWKRIIIIDGTSVDPPDHWNSPENGAECPHSRPHGDQISSLQFRKWKSSHQISSISSISRAQGGFVPMPGVRTVCGILSRSSKCTHDRQYTLNLKTGNVKSIFFFRNFSAYCISRQSTLSKPLLIIIDNHWLIITQVAFHMGPMLATCGPHTGNLGWIWAPIHDVGPIWAKTGPIYHNIVLQDHMQIWVQSTGSHVGCPFLAH